MVHRQARQASYHPINPRANKMAQLSPESTLLIVRAMFPFVGGVYRLSDDDQCLVEAARLTGGRGNILANLKRARDRKSTRLNSSHVSSSYAVFCLKK